MSVFRKHKTSADRSAKDRRRHRQKIEKALREGIQDVIADQSIIGKNGKTKVKIPVRGIKEYKFVYGENTKQVGQAPGKDVKRGKIIGKSGQQQGQGQKAGNQEGDEHYEVEITLDDLASYLFDDLELPDLEKKKFKNVIDEKPKRKGYRNRGIRPRLDKKETLKRRLKRRAAVKRAGRYNEEEDERFPFNERDLRYRYVGNKLKESSNAVIFFVMDTSGSMSKTKKYLARSFFFLLYQFLRYRYENIEIVFISHTTTAKEVNEEQFFTKAESGGTYISPAINKVKEIAEERYHPNTWNIYAFHASDGDNWSDDIEKSVNASAELKQICQLYCYCEIVPSDEIPAWMKDRSTMMNAYTPIVDRSFKTVKLNEKGDIWPVFKKIFGGKLGV
jgi:sporulation protein YhbH